MLYKFLALLALTVSVANAQEQADQVKQVAARFSEIVAEGQIDPKLKSEFCSKTDHGVCLMGVIRARQYCKRNHSRLPTLEELIFLAMSRGAKGFISPYKDDYYIKDEFIWTEPKTINSVRATHLRGLDGIIEFLGNGAIQTPGQTVEFIYSSSGYKNPSNYSRFSLISSTYYNEKTYETSSAAYTLDERSGNIGPGIDVLQTYLGSVRCVEDKDFDNARALCESILVETGYQKFLVDPGFRNWPSVEKCAEAALKKNP